MDPMYQPIPGYSLPESPGKSIPSPVASPTSGTPIYVEKGIENPVGAYNCFINVIIQSLWHLQTFREYFNIQLSQHKHTIKDKRLISHYIMGPDKAPMPLYPDLSDDPTTSPPSKSSTVDLSDPASFCLVCSLYELFVKFEYDIESSKPIELGKFRSTLAKMNNAQLKGFVKGSMGSAQETFEEILTYLHRSTRFGVYAEAMATGKHLDKMNQIELKIDQEVCNPPCAAHKIFGFQLCDLFFCSKCQAIINFDHLQPYNDQILRMNMKEFYDYAKKNPSYTFENLLCGLSLTRQPYSPASPATARAHLQCKAQSKHAINCLQPPSVLVLSFEWASIAQKELVQTIDLFFKKLIPCVDLRRVFSIQDPKQATEYILKGFVCFYFGHYIAYFFSDNVDSWMEYDDDKVKRIGDFGKLVKSCTAQGKRPILVFYESIAETKKLYCSQTKKEAYYESFKTNNYWKGQSCVII